MSDSPIELTLASDPNYFQEVYTADQIPVKDFSLTGSASGQTGEDVELKSIEVTTTPDPSGNGTYVVEIEFETHAYAWLQVANVGTSEELSSPSEYTLGEGIKSSMDGQALGVFRTQQNDANGNPQFVVVLHTTTSPPSSAGNGATPSYFAINGKFTAIRGLSRQSNPGGTIIFFIENDDPVASSAATKSYSDPD
ncbi:MAG TPA: hypothetical protein DCE41_20195 [Cytophagales bacterium]|nr:hypothetical protein [Cytophagales bacterium]HAA22704.1 hypothetical protein [Cytophagales bacterium]HAP64908.1 hypothetical protein [Cytophagales bacterium]